MPGVSTPDVRPPSPLDTLADRYVDEYAAADPVVATYIGVPVERQIGPLVVVPGPADVGGHDRIGRGVHVDVPVGQRVEGGRQTDVGGAHARHATSHWKALVQPDG